MTGLGGSTGRPVVYLHIGGMKTGTTYLQQLMYANRARLRDAGLVLPGDSWSRQVRGVQDVMRLGRRDPHIRRQARGVWSELLTEALADPASVSLISVEFLSFAGRRAVSRVMETLARADVRLVLTVRDMSATLSSQWQTVVHNGGKFSWEDYLDDIPRPQAQPLRLPRLTRRPRHEFHRTLNVPRMLTVWQQVVPAGSLHVVTVPRARTEPGELWRRFAGVVGVDPAAATRPPRDTNPSLGYASTELVRQVNRRIGRLPQSEYNWTVKEIVALDVLVTRAAQEGRAPMSRPAHQRAMAWNRLTSETISASGAVLTGDLEDLPVDADPEVLAGMPQRPPAPGSEEMLEAAELAAEALRALIDRRVDKLGRAGVEVERPTFRTPDALAADWASAADPVATAAGDLAATARQAAVLLRRLRAERRKRPDGLSRGR